MTQITPPTRSDDSKFSWSRSGHFLTPDTRARASTFLRARYVSRVSIPPNGSVADWDQVDTGSVADLLYAFAVPSSSVIINSARCCVRRNYARRHSQTRMMIFTEASNRPAHC